MRRVYIIIQIATATDSKAKLAPFVKLMQTLATTEGWEGCLGMLGSSPAPYQLSCVADGTILLRASSWGPRARATEENPYSAPFAAAVKALSPNAEGFVSMEPEDEEGEFGLQHILHQVAATDEQWVGKLGPMVRREQVGALIHSYWELAAWEQRAEMIHLLGSRRSLESRDPLPSGEYDELLRDIARAPFFRRTHNLSFKKKGIRDAQARAVVALGRRRRPLRYHVTNGAHLARCLAWVRAGRPLPVPIEHLANSQPIVPPAEQRLFAAAREVDARAVYADWLEEHGDIDRADYLRIPHRVDASQRQRRATLEGKLDPLWLERVGRGLG